MIQTKRTTLQALKGKPTEWAPGGFAHGVIKQYKTLWRARTISATVKNYENHMTTPAGSQTRLSFKTQGSSNIDTQQAVTLEY